MPVTRRMVAQPWVRVPAPIPLNAPTDITGCVLWLDAADTATITVATNAVTQWSSKDSGAKAFTQGTANLRPRSGLTTKNSKNVVDFVNDSGGSDFDYLTRSATDLDFTSGGFTFFAVYSANANTGNGVCFTTHQSAFGAGQGWYVDRGAVALMQSPSTLVTIGTAAGMPTGWDYMTFRSNAAGPLSDARLNGAANTPTSATVGHAASSGPQLVGAFQTGSAAAALNGSLAEIIVYNSALTDADVLRVETYLVNKWAL